MSYTALYRKFRPGEFEDVKGQDHISKTLQNQIKATESDMRISFVERGGPVRHRLRRYLQRR